MHTPAPAEHFFDQGGQLASARERQAFTLRCDSPGHAPRLGLFTEFTEKTRKFGFAGRIDQDCRGFTSRTIHPHIERSIMTEAEAALRRVELMRGDAKVEERTVKRRSGHNPGNFRGIGEVGLHRGKPVTEGCQTPGRVLERLTVTIEADHPRPGGKEGLGMATPTQRAVEKDATRSRAQQRDDLVAQNRLMPARGVRVCAGLSFCGGRIAHKKCGHGDGGRPNPPSGLPRLFSRKNRR